MKPTMEVNDDSRFIEKNYFLIRFFSLGFRQWKLGTFIVAIPVVLVSSFYNFAMEQEHPHRPDFAKYEYMRTRNKVRRVNSLPLNSLYHGHNLNHKV